MLLNFIFGVKMEKKAIKTIQKNLPPNETIVMFSGGKDIWL